ncbi:MAG: segregation/condensation protein A [Candidatus Omnitrophica bacterium]|nr:segregation/condensation protein A [Candidatus Omnitrophota bacterium]
MGYKLKLDVFEGPLDLLLYLIKKNDIDITDIPITKITEQYMQYIEMMKMLDLDIVGDFLVMAATLMHIKSKMLLPPDPSEEDEEEIDPRDELARRLLEYKKFKEIAETLKVKEEERKELFARNINEEERRQLAEDAKEVFFEANLFDLINALSEALRKVPEDVIHEITREEFTVEQKIHDVLHLLLKKSSVKVSKLFAQAQTKMEAIVTFLAILELIRLKEVKIIQTEIFGEIEVSRNKDNMIPESESSGTEDEQSQSDA